MEAKRRNKAWFTLLRLLCAVPLLLAVASCRTLPEGPYPDIVNWIPAQSDLVLRLDLVNNQELTDTLLRAVALEPEELKSVRNRTAALALGLELGDGLSGNQEIKIHLASVGIWPKAVMGGALGSDWKRSKVSRFRWTGPNDLELALLSDQELVLSKGRMDHILTRVENSTVSPAMRRAGSLRNGADLAIWLTNPDFIKQAIPVLPPGKDGEPLVDLVGIALRRVSEDSYSLTLAVYPTDERLSGTLALALRLALSARFGLSPDPEERKMMSDAAVEVEAGKVGLILPDMDLSMIAGFLEGIENLPEVTL